jgi:hypothetical protein
MNIESRFYELVEKIGLPDGVVEMHRYYKDNGFFKNEDILKVLGDPCKGVSMPKSEEEARNYFLSSIGI